MNTLDPQYLDLVRKILDSGKRKTTRNDDGTLSIFGGTIRVDLREGFPLLTTKKVHFKSIVHELIWMLSGSTNIRYLVENNVHIWSAWPHDRYLKERQKRLDSEDLFKDELETTYPNYSLKEFEERIKIDSEFAKTFGGIGEGGYGKMFRNFNGVDQITTTLANLKANPFSRRHVITLWNPAQLKNTILPPCHHNHVYNCEEMTTQERRDYMWRNYENYNLCGVDIDDMEDDDMDDYNVPKIRLNLSLFMRSSCVGIGLPFNIAQYALLLSMFAHCLNYDVGELMWTGVDCHLYSNLLEPITTMLDRVPRALPRLRLNQTIKKIGDFSYNDVILENYDPHDRIEMTVTV